MFRIIGNYGLYDASSMAELKLLKFTTGVQFSSHTPTYGAKFTCLHEGASRVRSIVSAYTGHQHGLLL
ncbi:uncharacterized protein METZ01_LOCUS488340 [marine metagenome]|uniref:Uncharacterized protein n=1 Tax=marine metagenome TaxID=408172 RepID=A0A383CT27_9ZZZZ